MRKRAFRVTVEGRWKRKPGDWVALESPSGFWLGFDSRGLEGESPIDSVPVGEDFVLEDEFDVLAFSDEEAKDEGVEAWWEVWGEVSERDGGGLEEFDTVETTTVVEL